jgi:hypothetical protein
MKRALNYDVYLLLAVAVFALFRVNRHHEELVSISLAVAIVTYLVVTNSSLRWAVPRRSRHVPSIAVCFLGAFLVSSATFDGGGYGNAAIWVAAFAGAFGFLFVAVKTGVPTHAGILVNTESVSAHWRDGVPDAARGGRVAQRMRELSLFHEPRFANGNFGVWPEHFEISQEGSVAWYIRGRAGTRATIRFDQGFDPFSEGGGAPDSVFEAVVPQDGPGIAIAGPVVQPGRGPYSIQIQLPGSPPMDPFIVSGGGSQKKG